MNRASYLLIAITVFGCTKGDEKQKSTKTDPTAELDVVPPQVDTGWPEIETDPPVETDPPLVETGDTGDTADTAETGWPGVWESGAWSWDTSNWWDSDSGWDGWLDTSGWSGWDSGWTPDSAFDWSADSASWWWDSGAVSGTGDTYGDTGSTLVVSCTCTFAETNRCAEFEAKDVSRLDEMADQCADVEVLCGDNDGTYSDGLVCGTDDLVGTCLDSNTLGGEATDPHTNNTFYYNASPTNWTAEDAFDDCDDPDEVFSSLVPFDTAATDSADSGVTLGHTGHTGHTGETAVPQPN
jgi:hypothetical protein